MEEIFFSHLSNLIAEKTGVRIGENKKEIFLKSLFSKSNIATKLNFEKYTLYLKERSVQFDAEWKLIFQILNISETYFFRDKTQIDFLKYTILPKLIEKNRDQKKIKIWIAGCSTGEEAYTISFLIQDLLLDIRSWNIQILATDINFDSIEKAKKAEYYNWSFRGVDNNTIQRYFDFFKDKYIVKPEYRFYIKFIQENLLSSFLRNEVDFILCRNVFIYMEKNIIYSILDVFSKALKDNSFLVTGHNEINGNIPVELSPNIQNGNTFYQKIILKNENYPLKLEARTNKIKPSFQDKKFKQEKLNTLINLESESSLLNKALILADSGETLEAKNQCKKILYINPKNYEANYLMGQILESESNFSESINYYQRVISINQKYLEAYLSLASLLTLTNKNLESKEIRKKGLELFTNDETLRKEYETKGYSLNSFESFFKDETATWV